MIKIPAVIDVVYTWVDSKDPAWEKNYIQYRPNPEVNPIKSYQPFRFRSNNELKFSLRSLEKNCDFINHIYIVTDDQRPSFLSGKEENITLISHHEIIPESMLPTFNSICIEAFIHKIDTLIDCFIYFNDDVFLNKSLSIEDLINLNSMKIKVFSNLSMMPSCEIISGLGLKMSGSGHSIANNNANNLLNLIFKKEERHQISHGPQVLYKPTIELIHSLHKQEIMTSIDSKFRSINSINFTNALYPYYMIYTGIAEFHYLEVPVLDISNDWEENNYALKSFESTDPLFFCLQDERMTSSSLTDKQIYDFLLSKFG